MHRYNFDETVIDRLSEITALLTQINNTLSELVPPKEPEHKLSNNPAISYTYVDEWE